MQKNFAVYVMEGFAIIREMETDIAHVGSAKQSIADSVDKNIGIAVPEQSK
jgi:hypothetical protein